MTTDTIVAQATAPGRGGVGIIRVSGPKANQVALEVTGKTLKPRYAEYLPFQAEDGTVLDQGIALYFPNPHSFTGEDVLELQGHGGPVVMDMLIKRILGIAGVRAARPGEFSERAFLNDKMDLTQAEAIADLIDASSEEAAKSALQSLQGQFSQRIQTLVESLIHLRIYVEAAIDFPEEEIDFLADGKVAGDLQAIIDNLDAVRKEANQGAIMREGMKVVIAGRPNAGKSSLLNALSGKESAIVTDIAGTTRDVLREHIHIDGMPLHIIDTAGLRDASDEVEKIGIRSTSGRTSRNSGEIRRLHQASARRDRKITSPRTHKTACGFGLQRRKRFVERSGCETERSQTGKYWHCFAYFRHYACSDFNSSCASEKARLAEKRRGRVMSALRTKLDSLIAQTDLDVSEKQREQLVGYVELLDKWNKAYNLTSVRDPLEMLVKHILDSIVVGTHLQGERFIDVGTGPGLPGIPLAIMHPEKTFFLLDSLGKRIRFIKQVVHTLGLKNVTPIQSRVEEFQPEEKFDGVLSRAFASMTDMVEWCHHLPKEQDGVFLALKGQHPKDEMDLLPEWCSVTEIISLAVPELEGDRHLVILSRKEN